MLDEQINGIYMSFMRVTMNAILTYSLQLLRLIEYCRFYLAFSK